MSESKYSQTCIAVPALGSGVPRPSRSRFHAGAAGESLRMADVWEELAVEPAVEITADGNQTDPEQDFD